MSAMPPPLTRTLMLMFVAFLIAGCGKKENGAGPAPAAAPPPPEVGVVSVALGSVNLVTELPGRLESSRVAQVRARAAGIVQERLFREGSDVRAGQPLYRIDPAPLRAALASAEATLARSQANLANANSLAERYRPLVEANAISKQEYANAVAAQKQAQAEVQVGRAAVDTARINLGYAQVSAPISGRIGRTLVTEGALVGQGESTPLAVIQQIHPLYANFTQSASEALALRRALAEGRLQRSGDGAVVRVMLEDGSEHPLPGRLLFADLTVDPTTGQVTLRAEIPNPNGNLLPGLYVRGRLAQAQAQNAVLLPQQAVTRGSQGDSVMVVGADGKVAQRSVKVGGSQGSQWVIMDGLKAGEQVIVDGFQKVRPGAPVKAVPVKDAAGAAAPNPGPGTGSGSGSGSGSGNADGKAPPPAAGAGSRS